MWALRAGWLTVPLTVGPLIADGLDGADPTSRSWASVWLWALWGVGLCATLILRPVALTVVRAGGSGLVAAAFLSLATADGSWGPSAVLSLVVAMVGALPAVGGAFVDGASYGDERRFLLRWPPVALVLGLVLDGSAAAALIGGPLLLAHGRTGPGVVVCLAAAVLVPIDLRAEHQMHRRWLVLVPAGLVVHDHLALAEPTLFQKSGLSRVGPAPADTAALDLTQGAHGLAVEIGCALPHDVYPTVRGGAVEATPVDALLVSPIRPDVVLAEAQRRGLPAG